MNVFVPFMHVLGVTNVANDSTYLGSSASIGCQFNPMRHNALCPGVAVRQIKLFSQYSWVPTSLRRPLPIRQLEGLEGHELVASEARIGSPNLLPLPIRPLLVRLEDKIVVS